MRVTKGTLTSVHCIGTEGMGKYKKGRGKKQPQEPENTRGNSSCEETQAAVRDRRSEKENKG